MVSNRGVGWWILSAFIGLVIVFMINFPSFASACSPLQVKSGWCNKFPFDVVCFDDNVQAGESCPQFSLWDNDFQMCSVGTITAIVKHIVVIKLVLDSLINL